MSHVDRALWAEMGVSSMGRSWRKARVPSASAKDKGPVLTAR